MEQGKHSQAMSILIERKKLLRELRGLKRRDNPEKWQALKSKAAQMLNDAKAAGDLTPEEHHTLYMVH